MSGNYLPDVDENMNLLAIVAATVLSSAESRKMPEFGTLDPMIVSNLTNEERKQSAVYLNESVMPAGKATVGETQVEIDHAYVLAFIDRQPGANWMHPCRYLIIDPTNEQFLSIDSNRPPVFGILPSSWRLIMHSPGVEDWQLMKIMPGQ